MINKYKVKGDEVWCVLLEKHKVVLIILSTINSFAQLF